MPSILALETSSDVCSIALLRGDLSDATIEERTLLAPREHTQRLLPMIESLLADSSVTLKQLNAIAYGCGPGSFTGLRICLSVAQGLAYGADLPLIAVSSLESLATTVARQRQLQLNSIVVSAVDARMDQIYWCAYRITGDDSVMPLLQEQVSNTQICEEWLLEQFKQNSDNNLYLAGSGASYIGTDSFDAKPVIQVLPDEFASAYDVAALSLEAYKKECFVSPLDAEPSYVRNEVSWKKRQRIRTK